MKNRRMKGPNKILNPTVLSSDADELNLRKQRGKKESFHIHPLNKYPFPFDTYEVTSGTGLNYFVEIRSMDQHHNSCSCADYRINTLGTCKHIEGVLHQISKKHISLKEPQQIEIFLNQSHPSPITITWPQQQQLSHKLKIALEPYFSSNHRMICDPVMGLSSIEFALTGLSPECQKKVRLSSHLLSWANDQKTLMSRQLTRQQFLDDVKAGKRSMQMLNVPLYPYQEEGMLHLAFEGRALLADEMGLGKTIQAIAACELLRRVQNIQRVLVICPVSLKVEWEEQIAKFTGLPCMYIQGGRHTRLASYKQHSFFYLANYEQVRNDFEEIQSILAPDVIILDEAQRIKNWQTKTAWAVKQLRTPYAFVLTGTPLENRIDELFSIMQVVDPHLLGPLHQFNHAYYTFNDKGKPLGYKNLDDLHRKLKPVLLRRLKKDVEEQLPERTVNNFFVPMHPEQECRYQEYSDKVVRLLSILKKRPLNEDESKKLQQFLACMRMLCDTPYILDEECKISPKLDELQITLSELLEGTDNKIIIFSEWERMLFLVREMIETTFQVPYAWHTGTVPQQKRRDDIKRFKEDPTCRFFLTTDAGSTGLNLQVANVVINMDLPWNPAKLEQRIARAWRKNQTRAVQVINFVCSDSIEHRMLSTLSQKKALADGVLDGFGDLSEMAFPSARKDVLDHLADMMSSSTVETKDTSVPSAPAETAPVAPTKACKEQFKNDVIAHFNDRVQQLHVHENSTTGVKSILAVVDNVDRGITPKLEELVHANAELQQHQLQLLDQQTYALLQKLAATGIITINTDTSQMLYRSPSLQASHETERQQRLTEAKKHQAEAARKKRMALLLMSGDFMIEALPVATDALNHGLKSYSALKKGAHQEGEKLMTSLKEPQMLSNDAARNLLEKSMLMIDVFSEEITKFALS